MKYRLPIIVIAFYLLSIIYLIFPSSAFAQIPAIPGIPAIPAIPGTPSTPSIGVAEGTWVTDANVTFVGKTASRSGDFLDWTLRNYDWACVSNTGGVCSNANNPLAGFWALIRNIIYAILIVVVLVAAFAMIVTRGKSITVMRFIPRFIFVIVLITLSYSLTQFIYQVSDIVQGFFLRSDGKLISTQDLIFIGFDYRNFVGYRVSGAQYDESAFITLLLVRLTAITYYVMTGVLLVRKIILWFFIILSPIFPLLLFFRPLRNTGKIWVGEFFRWLLYGPLFAVLLHGLVVLWKSPGGIPLAFDFTGAKAGEVVYPTAVNILIGGPGQTISKINSVNLQDTFALYVVALLMLWVVILLPFLLLKIFLDLVGGFSLQENTTLRKLWNRATPSGSSPPPVTPPPAPGPQGAGLAKQLPFNVGRTISEKRNFQSITSIPANAQILQLANLSVPKMRDIARFETSSLSKNTSHAQDMTRLKTSLSRIANPNNITSVSERERYHDVKQQLLQEKQKGNVLASSILSAANTTTTGTRGAIHAPNQKAAITTVASMSLPAVNKVQQVSIEDYEEVRKMWLDTYENSEPPTDLSGKKETREEWIKTDMDKINQAISLLSSIDAVRTNEGMEMVANILPFLMVGGFSKTEVIAYLKAKLEAAKSAISVGNKKIEEEETMVEKQSNATTSEKHMTTEAEAEVPKTDISSNLGSEDGQRKIEDLRKSGV